MNDREDRESFMDFNYKHLRVISSAAISSLDTRVFISPSLSSHYVCTYHV